MKNNFNALVVLLVLVCLADAGYRLYKTYKRLVNEQENSQLVK